MDNVVEALENVFIADSNEFFSDQVTSHSSRDNYSCEKKKSIAYNLQIQGPLTGLHHRKNFFDAAYLNSSYCYRDNAEDNSMPQTKVAGRTSTPQIATKRNQAVRTVSEKQPNLLQLVFVIIT